MLYSLSGFIQKIVSCKARLGNQFWLTVLDEMNPTKEEKKEKKREMGPGNFLGHALSGYDP